MASHTDLAEELLSLAADDEIAVRALLPVDSVSDSIVAFHAQQAVEKSLKAALAANKVEFPFSHDVARLLALCESAGFDLDARLAGAERLTPFGVRFRYGSAVAGDVARNEAAAWADAALTWARGVVAASGPTR
jgi:HEPN domain-containing protein